MRFLLTALFALSCTAFAEIPQSAKDQITRVALASSCAKSSFIQQGVPPKGFIKGIALSYAKSACDAGASSVVAASQPIGKPAVDALAWYGYKLDSPEKRLQYVYAMLIGSAARESSWRWCCGKDPGASNTSADTCEAGLYQTSFNSKRSSPELVKLFNKFKADKSGCFSAEYMGATTCSASNMKNWGVGDGLEFQKMTKSCPGFASEYAAIVFRTLRTHYGPINRKQAQVLPACVSMFADIKKTLDQDPGLCDALKGK